MLGSLAPILIPASSSENPHHAAKESFAPIRPCLAAVLPLAILGIERKKIGVIGNQPPHLGLRELERLSSPSFQGGSRIELRHRCPPGRSRHTPILIGLKSGAGASVETRQPPLGHPPCRQPTLPPMLPAATRHR